MIHIYDATENIKMQNVVISDDQATAKATIWVETITLNKKYRFFVRIMMIRAKKQVTSQK